MKGWLRRLMRSPTGERSADSERTLDQEDFPARREPESVTSHQGTREPPDIPGGKILFFDTETTGLHSTDRIVSFAGILLDPSGLANGEFRMDGCHFVFDPGRKSHPRAAEVHGFSDWFLRHQEPFSAHVGTIEAMFSGASLAVAHNAAFDADFVAREFIDCGREPPTTPLFCTMQAWRDVVGGRSSLSAVCATLGLERCGQHHGAMEDAYLAMMVYLSLRGGGLMFPFEQMGRLANPTNVQDVPPLPDGPLPRRKRRKTATA
ncbi:exonuclease domain-containing protein [Pseudomonas sp.]|uniref:3'-5' exonuclease n=1 Tax=Pseudomonas sp. TaxID=306 RepID=UPI003D0B4E46